MKLTRKLTIAIALVLTVQFCLYGYLVARRLTGFFNDDVKQDALQIGRALALAASQTWKTRGQEEAINLISAANSDYTDIQIRLVLLDGTGPSSLDPALSLHELEALSSGRYLVKHINPESDSDFVYTYYRLSGDSIDRQAAIELRQSFARESRFTTVSVLRVLAFLAIVVASTAALMWVLGIAMIARPIQRLREKARRVGQGDLSDHIELNSGDEIGELAHEINLMNDELLRARERVELETNARIAALEQLRHADRLTTIGTLASGVAHELGTPLTVAGGYLSRLQSAITADNQSNLCAPIAEQLEKMAAIVKQLLNYSRRKTPDKKPVPLQSLAERVVEMLRAFAAKRDIEITIESHSEDTLAEVDATQIEQVLANVIINALQAMERGKVTIVISKQEGTPPGTNGLSRGRYHCMRVVDTGDGMSEEEINQIFNPFFTTKESGQGTGMGLSIAQGIVAEHEGWISVTSTPGKGSEFSIFLPDSLVTAPRSSL